MWINLDIKTLETYKWKARLNVHGVQKEYVVNYTETYGPVVTWISVRLILIMSVLQGWNKSQIDSI